MANHEIVPTSAFTKGTAERKKSATSFSLPGFASSGTYSANFVITFSCFDSGHQKRKPAARIDNEEALDGIPSGIEVACLIFRPHISLSHICTTRTGFSLDFGVP